ncbi:helix-turn-helix domain-containing protein [Ekhidna sp.]
MVLNLGEQIAKYRKERGYSQDELSQYSGISLRTIQRIEKGSVQPRGYTLRALSETLKIEISELEQESSPSNIEVEKKARTLNSLGLLVLIFPLVSIVIQFFYWTKHKQLLSNHVPSKKVLSFQILWIIAVVITMSLIHILTYLLTGQSVYGHFPIRMLAYVLLLIANICIIFYGAIKMNQNATKFLSGVPALV